MAKPAPSLFTERPPSAASRGNSGSDTPYVTAIRSLEAADLALAELANLDATEKQIDGECAEECTLVREKFSARCQLVIEGRPIKIADRRAELEAALEVFAEKYGKQVFDEGAKSKKLNHGEFGFRKSNPKLEAIEGGPPKSFGATLDAIIEGLRKALAKTRLLFAGKVCDDRFLKIQVVLDRQALLTAAKKKEIGNVELRKVGLRFPAREDVFFVNPKAKEVASHSAEAPA